jgi:glycosyltransferase involved in cell wall biosynthesis/4-amino-4-deoxy-L-arabinose transferase-like glycosyltransferase
MLKKLAQQNKAIITIFLVALFLRLLVFGLLETHYGPGSFYLGGDESTLQNHDTQHYVVLANNMSKHGVYSRFVDAPLEPDSLRTPLLAFYFLPFVHYLGFGSIWLAMLLLVIILSAIPVASYLLAKLFLNKAISFLVGLLVAIQPLMVYFTNIAEPDMLMVLLFLLALYQFCLFYKNSEYKNLFISAVLLGLMTLAKPVGIYVAFIFLIFIFIKALASKKGAWQLVVFVLIFVAVLSPWLYRNYQVFGVVEMSAIKSTNLYLYYTVGFEKDDEILPIDMGEREPVKNIKYQTAYVDLAISRVIDQPVAYTGNHLTGTLRSMLSGDLQEIYHKGHEKILPFKSDLEGRVDITAALRSGDLMAVVVAIFSNFPLLVRYLILFTLYLLVVVGWLLSYGRDKKTFVLFTMFLVLTAYFFLASGPFVSPKYRLPIMPLLFIMALYPFSYSNIMSKTKKKIVVATGTYLPEVSGQSTFVNNFRQNLPADYELVIVSYGNKTEVRNGNIHTVKRNIFRYFHYYLVLRRQCKNAEFIYAQDLVSSGLPAAMAKRRENRLIIRIGGDFLWEKMVNMGKTGLPVSQYYDQPKSRIEKIYLKIYRYVLDRSDKIIFNTPWPQDWYREFFGIDKDKIQLIENPLILKSYNKAFENSPGDEIIYAGRFVPLKNLKRLIKAFKRIKTDKKLTLIGEGPQYSELVKLSADDSRISVLGKMDQTTLWQRISKCYLFVLPSISEFNPNMAIEVLNLNKPVVLTKEVGFGQKLKSKFKLVDPLSVNDIQQVLESLLVEDNYKKHLEVTRENIVTYDWSQVIDKHLSLFADLSSEINILNIGTDKGLVGGTQIGDVVTRHKKYGESVSNLDIIVYSNQKEELPGLNISSNVIGYPTNSVSKLFFFFDAVSVFRKINKKHKIDIVVCQDPFLPALVGGFLKSLYGVKLQINFHGDFWSNPSWLKERWINILFLFVSKFTVPSADAIRVMSSGQKTKLVSAGISADRVKVISTPVELDRFKSSKSLGDQRTVLHVGRYDKVKDFDTLFKAFELVNNKLPKTEFIQVGADLEKIVDKSKDLSFKSQPIVTAKNLAEKWYPESDMVVLSSTSESFGKVLVEAGAAGKPVVSTATTGAKEIIEDGKNGFLVPIGDADMMSEKIIYLLENPDVAKEMGQLGRKMVKQKYGDNTNKIISLWQDLKNK